MHQFIDQLGMGNPGLSGPSNDALPHLHPIRKVQSTTASAHLMPTMEDDHHLAANTEGGYTNVRNFLLGGGMSRGTELVCQEKTGV